MPLLLFLLGAACGWMATHLTPALPELALPAVTPPALCSCAGYCTIDHIGVADGRHWPARGLSVYIES